MLRPVQLCSVFGKPISDIFTRFYTQHYKLFSYLLCFAVQISVFGATGCSPAHRLRHPWSLSVDSQGLILANDCNNKRVLLLRFEDDHLTHLGDLLSKRLSLPETFYPRRICLAGEGQLYVGSGRLAADCVGVPADSQMKTIGSIIVFNVHNSSSD